jgi:predicted nucleic acid-binding protein
MITAVDTNVLLDILGPGSPFFQVSAGAVEQAANAGALVICDFVYAELCVHFRTHQDCDRFADAAGIRVEHLQRETLFLASRPWRAYRKQGGKRNRILADFLIGAHAQVQADRLLSRDRGFYGSAFPKLKLWDPSVP